MTTIAQSTVLYHGSRSAFATMGKLLAESAPEAIRARLGEMGAADLWCQSLMNGLRHGERTAQRLFPEVMGIIGAKQDIAEALARSIGAKDSHHMQMAASAALDAEVMDEESVYIRALEHVRAYRKERGMPPLTEAA